MPPESTPPPGVRSNEAGTGLIITPTFDASIDSATQTVINNAIAFYESTFSNNLTVNIYFYNMSTGLGTSYFVAYPVSFTSYRAALAANASSADDTTALANTPAATNNPVNNGANVDVKPANGRALGLNTPEVLFNFGGSPCPSFTGSGCIGINVTLANSHGGLLSVVEHEMDEILGLGSALSGTSTPADIWPEDLFRWASSGVRSYGGNTSSTNPCGGASAYFSIDGGATSIDQFNNCNNGGDYGDWIEHTPGQVQDAFTDLSTAPTLTSTSAEARALDVIGYTIAVTPAPTLSSITPSSGAEGTSFSAAIAGTNLTGATAVTFSGSGVTAAIGSGGTATGLPVTVTITTAAAVGSRTLTVTTAAGTSGTISFSVLPPVPAITNIAPASGVDGTSFSATITGTNLTGATAVTFSGSGVTAAIGSGGTSTSLPITITITSAATTGTRTLTVTTPSGTSVQLSFTVFRKGRNQLTSS